MLIDLCICNSYICLTLLWLSCARIETMRIKDNFIDLLCFCSVFLLFNAWVSQNWNYKHLMKIIRVYAFLTTNIRRYYGCRVAHILLHLMTWLLYSWFDFILQFSQRYFTQTYKLCLQFDEKKIVSKNKLNAFYEQEIEYLEEKNIFRHHCYNKKHDTHIHA